MQFKNIPWPLKQTNKDRVVAPVTWLLYRWRLGSFGWLCEQISWIRIHTWPCQSRSHLGNPNGLSSSCMWAPGLALRDIHDNPEDQTLSTRGISQLFAVRTSPPTHPLCTKPLHFSTPGSMLSLPSCARESCVDSSPRVCIELMKHVRRKKLGLEELDCGLCRILIADI